MKLKSNQEEFAKYLIEDIYYDVEGDEVYIEYYDNNINSAGCWFIALPKEVNNIEEFIAVKFIEELKRNK